MKNHSARYIRIISTLSVIILVLVHVPAIVGGNTPLAAENITSTTANGILTGTNKMVMVIAAMGAIAVSCITSAYALAKIGSAALGAMSEKPEIGARAVIFLGLAEGIAIYGLIVAIMILNKV